MVELEMGKGSEREMAGAVERFQGWKLVPETLEGRSPRSGCL
jgi:hypothetical protein